MSIRRRSSRFAAHVLTTAGSTTTPKPTEVTNTSKTPLVETKIKQQPSSPPPLPSNTITKVESTTIKVEKQKRKKIVKSSEAGAPENWSQVYQLIESYRQTHPAVVDTMGCERLADEDESVAPATKRFQTLIALMLSAQTKDTVTSATVYKLKQNLPTGLNLESILKVEESQLDTWIHAVGFHTRKAGFIKRTAEILRDEFGGDVPDTIEGLTRLPGVGPKMGYLTLQVAWNKNMGIGVDVHVHRISNRLGWVHDAKSPEDTRMALQSWLPKEKWRGVNPMLVGFGQIVCLPRGPKCAECPVNAYCPSAELKKTVKKQKVKQQVVDEDGLGGVVVVKSEQQVETDSLSW